jgi:hypothetical protein
MVGGKRRRSWGLSTFANYSQRTRTFDSRGGQNPNLIDQHLNYAIMWASFDATQSTQVAILRELCQTYNESMWPYLKGTWTDQHRGGFQAGIEKTYAKVQSRVLRLSQTSQELINLVVSRFSHIPDLPANRCTGIQFDINL